MKVIVAAVLFIIFVIYFAPTGSNSNNQKRVASNSSTYSATDFMQGVNEKVISDAKREYQIASSSGNPVDRCVHAGLVAAAYIQAHDQSNYQQWKMREDSDCNYTSTR
jgi:hypothetical protein